MNGFLGDKENIFGLLFHRAPNLVFLTIFLDAISGMAYAMIIPLVIGSIDLGGKEFAEVHLSSDTFLTFEVSRYEYAKLFLFIVLFILIAKAISRISMERVAANVTANLRIEMYRQLVHAPVFDVEKIGPGRIMAALTDDVPWLISAGRLFPTMLSNMAALGGMLGYLAYLNTDIFWFVMSALLVGVVTYQIPMFIGLRFMQQRRNFVGELHQSIRGLLDGFKELKLDKNKRENFSTEYLYKNEFGVRDANKASNIVTTFATTYGDLISFLVIGVVCFIFVNYRSVSSYEMIAVIMTLLYITGPVAGILSGLPQYIAAGVSLKMLNELFARIPKEDFALVYEPAKSWDRISYRDMCFSYPAENGKAGFSVGPFDFEIEKGSVTFLVGGNGSGKSTLGKLITLHYQASNGDIYFGDERISKENVNIYRQKIGFIYSDYYLFERLLGESGPDVFRMVDKYLSELGLADKVSFSEGVFSTLALSDGQKRRLALLVSFVEDKDLYLFDEWAADQDPEFKKVFYYHILPELKRKNKAVVVISHDDRYFDVGDKIFHMEDGRFVGAGESISSGHGLNGVRLGS